MCVCERVREREGVCERERWACDSREHERERQRERAVCLRVRVRVSECV